MLKSPVGTLTFLMTDIEGSTRLWETNPEAMGRAVLRSEAIIHDLVTAHDGYHVVEQGEGDSTLSVFLEATNAGRAAVAIRDALELEHWPDGALIRVRTGLHSGVADMRQHTYYGRAVNRSARIRAVGHGGQIILSRTTRELLDPRVFPSLKDHGPHRLKDLLAPEHLFEIVRPDVEFPPLLTLNSRINNLPAQFTSFIGREKELRKISGLLKDHRLVSLLGPGGIGKTRLAIQAAAETLEAFPDGVFIIDLTKTIHEEGIEALLRTISQIEGLEQLKSKQILFIFDNCEHLVAAVAAVAQRLLMVGPEVRILATSREALHLTGEHAFRVSPFGDPPVSRDIAQLEQSEAVQLFVERAAAKSHFVLTEANAEAIARICKALDGIPLAIELAASRIRVLGHAGLLRELAARFRVLKGDDGTAASRHQTLKATIDHSYELLTPKEQTALRCLAVFRSGWSLASAEAILPEAIRPLTLDLVESLYDKSLIQIQEDAQGETRGSMLETIRDYAIEKLADDDAPYLALCRWVVTCAGDFESDIQSGRAEAAERMDRDLANFGEALAWCIRNQQLDLGLEIVERIWSHWRRRGLFAQGYRVAQDLLSLPRAPTKSLSTGFSILGTLAWFRHDLESASEAFERSLQISREIGDDLGIARAMNNLGLIATTHADFDEARKCLSIARDGYLEFGEFKNAISAGINLGMLAMDQGRFDEAETAFRSILPPAMEVANPGQLAVLYTDLAEALVHQERASEAERAILEACSHLRDAAYEGDLTMHALAVGACILTKNGGKEAAQYLIACNALLHEKFGIRRSERVEKLEVQVDSGSPSLDHNSLKDLPPSTIARMAIDHLKREIEAD